MKFLSIAITHLLKHGASAEGIKAFVDDVAAADPPQDYRSYERERKRAYREMSRTVPDSCSLYNNINKQSKRGTGETMRELGCNPRANGTNPRALGTNPRAMKKPTGEPKFDEFWSIYPRKIARGAALKAWKAAISHGSDPDAIIAGAKAYALEIRGTEPKYIKYPQGWLSGERWLDQPVKSQNAIVPGPWKPVERDKGPNITEEERQANLEKLAKIRFQPKGI